MTTPCKWCKLNIAPVYQKSFETVYIGAIYVFLVIVLLETTKTVNNSKLNFLGGEFGPWSGKHHLLDFREGANKWTTTPPPHPKKKNFYSKNVDKF